ncbi:MAG TPA: DUF1345 domain-containing protein [Stellaceae bacterium]|nr:DUF1345 domain-containing protein [Stellaceae bacterium]
MLVARLHVSIRDTHPGLRLLICAIAGGLLFYLLRGDWGIAPAAAFGWIVAVLLFLVLATLAVGIASPERLRTRARIQDASRWVIQVLIVLAAVASLAAVIALLKKVDGETTAMLASRVALAGAVVVLSWTLIHTVFAVHYAHAFYGDGPLPGPDDAGGLLFPGGDQAPDFWDFFYFSLVLGMTCQVSDVQITGKHMRRLASVHGALSFFFNTVILALTINFLVSAFQ